jgi:hypothetical protein
MAPSKSLPSHALRVCTYAELQRYARAFGDGHLNLLILCGAPGVGKSRLLRQTVGADVCWIDGNASAFGIYQQAYEKRNQPIVLDDVDGLYRDRNGIRLLKTLCQTEAVKSVSWQTDSPALERRGIPRQFTTTSRVAFIANHWNSLSADVAALEDRGHLLVFEPAAADVHRQAASWFWDQEIFDFVASVLHLMPKHSFRTYLLGWELKNAGLDWQSGILARCLTGTALTVANLRADQTLVSEENRVTYFNHAKKIVSQEAPPAIKLLSIAPPTKTPGKKSAATTASESRENKNEIIPPSKTA